MANSTRSESVAEALLDGRMTPSRSALADRCRPWQGRCDGRGAGRGRQPARLKVAVEGSGNAFMNEVHAAVLVTTVLCVVGALLAR
ncbi:hypothetical protein [Streptomyces sp. NBC_01236]|uniref:hypothetical protein n=1 Tax=Streptomyces sp. NBC_01236 TaxID=2903789 RepID=UPI002E0DDA69|nr:hypothetical protein OG324_10065 [Streptomyces sp. NBC_01236]